MFEIVLYAILIILLLIFLYKSGKKKGGFVRHFSRGDYLRELNKKIEKDMEEKKN